MAQHPLEPLSELEFRQCAAVLRREQGLGPSWRFASIELREPAKVEVKAWRVGDPVPRTAHAVLWDRADNQCWDALVDLGGDRVIGPWATWPRSWPWRRQLARPLPHR